MSSSTGLSLPWSRRIVRSKRGAVHHPMGAGHDDHAGEPSLQLPPPDLPRTPPRHEMTPSEIGRNDWPAPRIAMIRAGKAVQTCPIRRSALGSPGSCRCPACRRLGSSEAVIRLFPRSDHLTTDNLRTRARPTPSLVSARLSRSAATLLRNAAGPPAPRLARPQAPALPTRDVPGRLVPRRHRRRGDVRPLRSDLRRDRADLRSGAAVKGARSRRSRERPTTTKVSQPKSHLT